MFLLLSNFGLKVKVVYHLIDKFLFEGDGILGRFIVDFGYHKQCVNLGHSNEEVKNVVWPPCCIHVCSILINACLLLYGCLVHVSTYNSCRYAQSI